MNDKMIKACIFDLDGTIAEDKKTLKKINALIEDICRNGNQGIGKPEPLTGNLAGFWSRRINDKDRLIYQIDDENVYILACRYHYTR